MHRLLTLTNASFRQCRWLIAIVGISSSAVFAADIQIRNLEDFDFGLVPATVGDLSADASFCVSMEPRGRYSLIGAGDGAAGGFALIETGTGADSIDYRVRITDRGRRRGQLLNPGVPLTNLRASRQRPNGRCNPPARIGVVIPGTEISGARPGHYNGTLTLTVVPE